MKVLENPQPYCMMTVSGAVFVPSLENRIDLNSFGFNVSGFGGWWKVNARHGMQQEGSD
jgi:hypothetical protein